MKIHFIGIGGIGISALAQYYLSQGAEVFGSDLVCSEIIELLKEKGAKIKIGKHNAKNIAKDLDLVIYSPAVQEKNPELKQARKLNIKSLSYPQALGELTKKYFTIAISGAHGKSTTTSMVALILQEAGLDPMVIVGTKLKEFSAQGGPASGWSSNFRAGKSKYLVIESDEWNASFLNYWPKIIVLTNIEREHLDFYRDLDHIMKTFQEYVGHLDKEGVLINNADNINTSRIKGPNLKNYSLKQKEAGELKNILQVPGDHNISNALAALIVARNLGIADGVSYKALAKYQGAWRRFEERDSKIKNSKFQIIDDYGHHPTEIRVTLQAAREKYPNKQIWCVFQPHQYQRTYNLFNDFIQTFRNAPVDKIMITDIYSVVGRERAEIKRKVNSKALVKAIQKENVMYLAKNKIKGYLEKNLRGGEVVIFMGAGDIYDIARQL